MYRKREPLERQYWKFYDPLMIADAFLALGTIMACGRLLRYVQLHSTIGPIQIALGKMIMNIFNFVLFFVVVMSSFMLGKVSAVALESFSTNAHTIMALKMCLLKIR